MIGSLSRLPSPADVIEYAFLWAREADSGLEEGRKPRPCLVLGVEERSGVIRVAVVPITTAPHLSERGVELPAATGTRLKLRSLPCWIVFTDVNEFTWPGPDLRPAPGPDRQPFWRYGAVSHGLYRYARDQVLSRYRSGSAAVVRRTD